MHQYSSAGFTTSTNNTFVNSPIGPGGMTSSTQTTAAVSNNSNNNNNQSNDFGFEFLEGLPGDQCFSAQDLLSSLDSTSNFNLNDIL